MDRNAKKQTDRRKGKQTKGMNRMTDQQKRHFKKKCHYNTAVHLHWDFGDYLNSDADKRKISLRKARRI